MKHKSIIGIGIAAVALVLAVAAVAVWILMGFRSAPAIDAQAVIADACAGSKEVESYRLVLTGSESRDGKLRGRFRYDMKRNGSDMYLLMENPDTIEQGEQYIVGDKFYHREKNLRGEWSSWIVKEFQQEEPLGPVTRVDDVAPVKFCGVEELENHQYQGEVQVDNRKVKHFTAVLENDRVEADWQFWVDDSGKLRKLEADETYFHGLEGHTVGILTYPSQPFTITAPVVP